MSARTRINLVQKIYHDVANAAGYSRPRAVWLEAQKTDRGITLTQVQNIMRSIPTYTLHRYVKRVPVTRRYLSSGLNHYFQMDLFVLNESVARANGFRYILFCIDTFSRKLFARPLKTKTGVNVANAIRSIIKENNSIPPKKVLTDKGTEFSNTTVKQLFSSYGITHFTSENVYHAAMVERTNRTLREKFGRYMTDKKTTIFIPILKDFVTAYNQAPHSALPQNMSPSQVTLKNKLLVWKHQFASHFRRAPKFYGKPKLKVGDVVRISKFQGKFKKSSDTTFTEELFVITHLLETKPTTYKLAALGDGEPIAGAFYREEIQPVTQ